MLRISTLTKALNLFGAGKHGFRNGDMATSTPPTDFDAEWCNGVQEEIMTVIEAAGITPSDASYAQLLEAIKRMIDIQAGNYALDTGAANAYVIALDPVIAAYTDGMTVRFRAVNANTGASTLNAGGGAVALVNDVAGALVANDVPAGGIISATYDAALNKFLITSLVPSQALSQAAADARYAALAGLATQLFSAADGASGKQVVNISQFASSLAANGYQKLPSGLIIQWGTTGSFSPGTSNAITLPVAFPTACVSVNYEATTSNASTASTQAVSAKTTTTFTMWANQVVPSAYNWIAIGY